MDVREGVYTVDGVVESHDLQMTGHIVIGGRLNWGKRGARE